VLATTASVDAVRAFGSLLTSFTLLTMLACSAEHAGAPADDRPNIVLVLVDDLAWADIGEHAPEGLRTPHIDALADSGVRFTNAYAVAPVCSPSRAGLLTGRYPQRFGHEHNTGPVGRQQTERIGLPRDQPTLADALGAAGYVTGLVGKWHLGAQLPFQPLRRGFDEFFGFLPGHHAYLPSGSRPENPLLRGERITRPEGYLTDAFSREAVDFIERHAPEPFFLMLSYSAVHRPLETDPERLARFAQLPEGPDRTFAAVLAGVDDGVGEVVAALRASGIEHRTLILFTSDNGGEPERTAPLRGAKGSLYEGGIRVPLIASWPGRLPAGSRVDAPVSGLDVYATALAAAQVDARATVDPLDGVDLIPLSLGDTSELPHDALFWRMGDTRAMRSGRWKLHWKGRRAAELYDLEADPRESRNRAAEQRERLQQMEARYQAWEAELVAPLWVR